MLCTLLPHILIHTHTQCFSHIWTLKVTSNTAGGKKKEKKNECNIICFTCVWASSPRSPAPNSERFWVIRSHVLSSNPSQQILFHCYCNQGLRAAGITESVRRYCSYKPHVMSNSGFLWVWNVFQTDNKYQCQCRWTIMIIHLEQLTISFLTFYDG